MHCFVNNNETCIFSAFTKLLVRSEKPVKLEGLKDSILAKASTVYCWPSRSPKIKWAGPAICGTHSEFISIELYFGQFFVIYRPQNAMISWNEYNEKCILSAFTKLFCIHCALFIRLPRLIPELGANLALILDFRITFLAILRAVSLV